MKSPGNIRSVVHSLLREGATPKKVAASLVAGGLVGILPVLGVTTALCTVIALVGRLNLIAIQAANWAASPLQLALLYPFYQLGAFLFGGEPLPFNPRETFDLLRDDFGGAFFSLGMAIFQALCAWAAVSALLAIPLYLLAAAVIRRIWQGTRAVSPPAYRGISHL